jgi:hypothetical protein
MLKEHKRHAAFRAEAPVRVADSIRLDKAGWSRHMGAFRHIYLRGYPFGMLRLQLGVNPEDVALPYAQPYRRSFLCTWPRDIPRHLPLRDKMAPSATANLLDDGVGDTLGLVGAISGVCSSVIISNYFGLIA